jgi:UDP-N-acetylmuramate: L-alanyl-gamma-D-glutamyl-meso-diaminopimelate ligase
MVAVARLAIEAGWEVRGSDNPLYPPTSDMVAALGVPVADQYNAANLDWEPDCVVIGNALSRGHVEVEAALERGLQYISFPEFLKEAILRNRKPVVICGTHGKTTTTTLTAYLLAAGGLNPGYLIGGQPLDFEESSRLGEEGTPFVVEGDEYDTAFFDKRAKFFHYLPRIAVVTSLEYDHADIYDSVEEIELAFQRMLRQIPQNGHLLLCADSPRALALKAHAYCQVHTYGFSESADWRIVMGDLNQDGQALAIHHQGQHWGQCISPLLGHHNAQNVGAALVLCALHDLNPGTVLEAVSRFKGIRRRMEIFHRTKDKIFIDDFAHHPTAIEKTVQATRLRWPDHRLTVLVEPRSNTMATNQHQNELPVCFKSADHVWIGPIFREEKYSKETLLDRHQLCTMLKENGTDAQFTDDIQFILDEVNSSPGEKEIVLILSNGAFDGIYEKIRSQFE